MKCKDNRCNPDLNRNICVPAWKLTARLAFFSIPFLFAVLYYFLADPFMVLREYEVYDSDVILNESNVGWKIYCNARDSIPFNSFILGNSCTMAYRCADWESVAGEGSRAVRLFGNSESIKAVLLKLRALEKDGAELRNVLVILDPQSLSDITLPRGCRYLLPPEVSGMSSFEFHSSFLQGFLMPDFLFPYIKSEITGRPSPKCRYLNPFGRVRNSENNDCINPRDAQIESEGESYWIRRLSEFPFRPEEQVVSERVIYDAQRSILSEIEDIFLRNGTRFRIVISPDYCQLALNPGDMSELQAIFGEDNVFDFSGINEFTEDIRNYYESAHYRVELGRRILAIIY